MIRCLIAGAALLALHGSAYAADLPYLREYLNHPSLAAGRGGAGYYRAVPVYRPPVAPAPTHHAPAIVPTNAAPTKAAPPSKRPAALPLNARRSAVAPAEANADIDRGEGSAQSATPVAGGPSPVLILVILMLLAGTVVVIYRGAREILAAELSDSAAVGDPDEVGGRGSASAARRPNAVARPRATTLPALKQSGFPSQEGWARRAGKVRSPVSGFFFGVGARANARALDEEQKRMKSARGVIKEYAGMYDDLLKGEEAATAHAVRRDLAGDHYEHELAEQAERLEEAAHRRQLGRKRRTKELTEADTRRIEAQHEQEALMRFKELKFAAGEARFEAKSKEHLVDAATADAAIAETKAPPQADSDNESDEVVKLYALLQGTMKAIEEGERLGRDTQALRERAELYKKLLNLA